jgi:hypothetical protein
VHARVLLAIAASTGSGHPKGATVPCPQPLHHRKAVPTFGPDPAGILALQCHAAHAPQTAVGALRPEEIVVGHALLLRAGRSAFDSGCGEVAWRLLLPSYTRSLQEPPTQEQCGQGRHLE